MSRHISAPDADRRPPAFAVTYGGDQVDYFGGVIAGRRACGPQSPSWPVAAVCLPEVEATVVGFSLLPPPGVRVWERGER